jgi:two-component system response regulator PilR (NtrC family)
VVPAPSLSASALQRLRAYPFPGNVRELENVLHRALALSGGQLLEAEDLDLPDAQGLALPAEREAEPVTAPSPLADGPLPDDLAAYLDRVERVVLERALAAHRYNRTAAGASLGLSLRQMRYRMARLGIGGPEGDGGA